LADVQARIAELSAERAGYLHCPQEIEALYSQKKAELADIQIGADIVMEQRMVSERGGYHPVPGQ